MKINHFIACSSGVLPLIQAMACCLLSITSVARHGCPCNRSSLRRSEQKRQGAGSSSRGQAMALAGYRGGDRLGRFGSLLPDPRVTQEKPPRDAVVLRGALGGRFPYFWGPRAGREWVVLPAGRREGGQL